MRRSTLAKAYAALVTENDAILTPAAEAIHDVSQLKYAMTTSLKQALTRECQTIVMAELRRATEAGTFRSSVTRLSGDLYRLTADGGLERREYRCHPFNTVASLQSWKTACGLLCEPLATRVGTLIAEACTLAEAAWPEVPSVLATQLSHRPVWWLAHGPLHATLRRLALRAPEPRSHDLDWTLTAHLDVESHKQEVNLAYAQPFLVADPVVRRWLTRTVPRAVAALRRRYQRHLDRRLAAWHRHVERAGYLPTLVAHAV